jgi:choline dehydrogenase-like flavoprotein
MITDLNRLEPCVFESEICVIGTGAAGIAIIREFIGTHTQVIVLESGSQLYETKTQNLYDSNIVGLPHNSIHSGRGRILGGTTTLWAGQALPLNPIDFEQRAWIRESGWGFDRAHLEPYYRRAERVMNLPESSYDHDQWSKSHLPPPPFDSQRLIPVVSQFSPTPNFGKQYYKELLDAPNIQILLHANVVNIQASLEANFVEHIDIKTLEGKTAIVKARYYIVCCGAIETARLLLASNTIEKSGLGNQYDLVGRYFQEHLQYPIGQVSPRQWKSFDRMFTARKHKGIKSHPQFAMSSHVQQQEQVLNAVGSLYYPPESESSIEAVKTIIKSLRERKLGTQLPGAIKKIAKNPNQLLFAAYRYFILKQPAQDTSGPPYLGIATEQQPNPLSRVYLGDEVDALGMRRVCLDWRVTDLDTRTAEVFVKVINQEFQRLDLGKIDLSSFQLTQGTGDVAGRLRDAAHHMGTARMSATPKHGVVNEDCCLHSVHNLYIGSSAVFPTGGASNPTLTIIALCLRIADHLKYKLTY